jgi:hypothetical protein
VYAGKYTVAYLKSLGFDVMDDIVDHRYDQLDIESNDRGKLVEFVWTGISAAEQLKRMPRDQLVNRCQQAAAHNQSLLLHMRRQWPVDFVAWWQTTLDKIK